MLHNSFSPLNYQCIENDDIQNHVGEADDGDNECNVSYHPSTLKAKLQSNVFANKFPENDVNVFTNKKTVPGNSEYSSVIKDGKSICILSDSIGKCIKINKLNKYIKNKKAYKRCFDGADTKALHHYAIHTLTNNKPDIVIINIGSNNMRKDKPISIADAINNISYFMQKLWSQ